ncbi:protein dachsous [Betta splendens]|uniref:Protein dachsous n=1 Tax=Betta splendens TaxID=158456 RepID=A0A6P7M3B9_BETSP|nr:protein dachsous [Betta splendens]
MDPLLWWSLVVAGVCVVGAEPLGTSVVNCNEGGAEELGPVDEGYTGDVELLTHIPAGLRVKLVPHLFPTHLEFLELSFTDGDATASVRTRKPLDADVLSNSGSTLYYSVMCDGIGKLNNTRTLKLVDTNDNAPEFKEKFYKATVSETQQVDTEVLRVTAVDADSTLPNNRLTYSIEPASEDFLVTNSGAFLLKRRLNYNRVSEYGFTVKAQDDWGLNDTASVQIHVTDYDDFSPYFSHSQYQASVLENEVGSLGDIRPEAIKAQDGDMGINATLIYSISAVSPDRYRPNFSMDSGSGVLSVVTALDRDQLSGGGVFVGVTATQTDDAAKTADCVVFVAVEDVNDNAPEFDPAQFSVELLENSPLDAVLFRAIVKDRDQGGFDGTLRIVPESAPFSISSDGTVSVRDSALLDREATEEFTFMIEATETEAPNHVATAEVSVKLLDANDNSPAFNSSRYEGKVSAEQTEGTVLVQVQAEDPDAGVNGQIRYSIEFGNDNGYFSISESTGEVSLAKLIPLVENRILTFQLLVTARDGGITSCSSSAQVTIQAPGDSKPQFLQRRYRGTVEEEQEAGVVVTEVQFFAIVPVVLEVKTEADKFSISPSGEFTTTVELDFDEGPHSYSVEISISDGVTSDTAIVEVQVTDVNDNSPVFIPASITESIPEDAAVGSNVLEVSASDKDSGFNKELRYSLRGGEGTFFIHPVSGMLSVAGVLDRETRAQYEVLLVAEDQGRPAQSATASLLLQVSDVNDNTPVFSGAQYQVQVLETEPVGANLLTLSAADTDEGANGRVVYSIAEQSPSSEPAVFELDSSKGILRLVQALNYSEVKVYNLRVQATDGGTPSLTGTVSVVVTVIDVNNNPPEFSQDRYDEVVAENLPSGAAVLALDVSDKDQGGFSNGFFICSSDTFDVNKQGVVSLRKNVSLDRETMSSYVLLVVAVDQVTDGLSATAQVRITVLDYNDNSPQFLSVPDPLDLPEGLYTEESPREVFTIQATDADLDLNGEVVLSLASPHPLFRIREDGMLLAVGDLDRESQETYELVIKASDRGSPQRENFTTITIRLLDVNDNRPEFSSNIYMSNILVKDTEEGKVLLTLSATDRDAGDNSLVTYSIVAGASPFLALNSETGEVTLTSDLSDLKEDIRENMTVEATDHGRPPLSSTASVIVNLEFSLVKGVTFESSSYNFSLPENQQTGVLVGKVQASAGSSLYDVTYSLKTETDLFSMDASGALVTRTPLDREQQQWYFLDVEAVDTRMPPTSATAAVRVLVKDVNEPPQFPPEVYKASVFSVAPYKSPVVYVKASDPDFGDQAALLYTLSAGSPYFDVDPSSGLVFVVSAAGLAGQTAVAEVRAADPQNLHATIKVEVSVQESASSDVVVVSLNRAANVVEEKLPSLERSLGAVLDWTVSVLNVWSSIHGAATSRAPRSAARTRVGFIAARDGGAVSSGEVTKKLQSRADMLRAELSALFGDGTDWAVELEGASGPPATVVALSVLLGLSVLGLIGTAALLIWFKRKDKHMDSDKESFDISRKNESCTNSQPMSGDSKPTRSEKKQQATNKSQDDVTVERHGGRYEVMNKNGDESQMSSL